MVTTWRVWSWVLMAGVIAGAADAKCPVGDSAEVSASTADLRARGPQGLEEALRQYDQLLAKLAALQDEENKLHSATPAGEPGNGGVNEKVAAHFDQLHQQMVDLNRQMEQMAATIDEVGGQRSCTVSRLYWYTDLEKAKEESAKSGRPILSLRMLGKLTDEYSCANSRFFRTALYSNKEVSDFLRTNFVLHWQSVRPVPRVTIDFGDGRKLERTLTGNSAHYVLASDGTPLDVLPGLYSPLAFRQWVRDIAHFYGKYQNAAAGERTALLHAFHNEQLGELLRRWDFDIQRLGAQRVEFARLRVNAALESAKLAGQDVPASIEAPNAARAFASATTKTVSEAPVLRFAQLGGTWMERAMDEDLWKALADLHRPNVKLDPASIELMRREAPPAADAARRAVSKSFVEDPILRVVRAFEDSIALDTVRNEYLLHRRVHEKFLEGSPQPDSLEPLNEWVYAELFLTPSSDPWLGLAPRDVYTALEGDGRTEPAAPLVGRAGG